ncbi:IS110 family transposase, partial [uncultured Microscilla sp.]|uniref:IS110 family transposase n=1 Tax=uncultured Microscilla sp. TaxID=432653 RepID=UPI002626EA09
TPNEENKDIIAKVKNVLTIPGVGYIVMATVLAETNGFLEIKNIRQLIHYAALVVKHHQSGEIKGKSYVSKKGNQHLKAVLFFPAFAAIRAADQFKEYYQKVTETRNGTAGNLAVCRKVLTLIYTLWKNDTTYEPNYKGGTSSPL